MIARRNVVGGALLGSLSALIPADADAAAAEPAAAAAEVTEDTAKRVVQAISDLRNEVENLKSFADLEPVRNAQMTFLRANGKFPDFMEVGITVWFTVHDWHVRWQQPLNMGRDNLARYTIQLNQTLLIMRTDVGGNFIGLPYDNR